MGLAAQAGRLKSGIDNLVDESAREWQISRLTARVHFWSPLAFSLVVLASKVHQPIYHFLIMEDGLVEWTTFFFALIAACAAGWITYCRWTDGYRSQAVLFGLFTLALVFLAGEEISWGQRVFGFETPESLENLNRKNEMNLHNIGNFLSWTPFITLVAGMLGMSAWVINRRIRVERYIDDGGKFFIPPFFLSSSFLIVLLFSLSQFTILPLTGNTSTRFAEVSELCLAYGCCIFTWLVATRMRNFPGRVAVVGRSGQTMVAGKSVENPGRY